MRSNATHARTVAFVFSTCECLQNFGCCMTKFWRFWNVELSFKNHLTCKAYQNRQTKQTHMWIYFLGGGPIPFLRRPLFNFTEVQNEFLIIHYDVSDRLGYVWDMFDIVGGVKINFDFRNFQKKNTSFWCFECFSKGKCL